MMRNFGKRRDQSQRQQPQRTVKDLFSFVSSKDDDDDEYDHEYDEENLDHSYDDSEGDPLPPLSLSILSPNGYSYGDAAASAPALQLVVPPTRTTVGHPSILSSLTMTAMTPDQKKERAQFLQRLYQGVTVKDRRYRMRVYRNCFVGSEAVDFMVASKWAKSREEAVTFGQRILQNQYHLFDHVVDPQKHPFKDDYLFFKFNDRYDETGGGTTTTMAAEPSLDIESISVLSQASTASPLEGSTSATPTDKEGKGGPPNLSLGALPTYGYAVQEDEAVARAKDRAQVILGASSRTDKTSRSNPSASSKEQKHQPQQGTKRRVRRASLGVMNNAVLPPLKHQYSSNKMQQQPKQQRTRTMRRQSLGSFDPLSLGRLTLSKSSSSSPTPAAGKSRPRGTPTKTKSFGSGPPPPFSQLQVPVKKKKSNTKKKKGALSKYNSLVSTQTEVSALTNMSSEEASATTKPLSSYVILPAVGEENGGGGTNSTSPLSPTGSSRVPDHHEHSTRSTRSALSQKSSKKKKKKKNKELAATASPSPEDGGGTAARRKWNNPLKKTSSASKLPSDSSRQMEEIPEDSAPLSPLARLSPRITSARTGLLTLMQQGSSNHGRAMKPTKKAKMPRISNSTKKNKKKRAQKAPSTDGVQDISKNENATASNTLRAIGLNLINDDVKKSKHKGTERQPIISPSDRKMHRRLSESKRTVYDEDADSEISGMSLGSESTATNEGLEQNVLNNSSSFVGITLDFNGIHIAEEDRVYDEPDAICGMAEKGSEDASLVSSDSSSGTDSEAEEGGTGDIDPEALALYYQRLQQVLVAQQLQQTPLVDGERASPEMIQEFQKMVALASTTHLNANNAQPTTGLSPVEQQQVLSALNQSLPGNEKTKTKSGGKIDSSDLSSRKNRVVNTEVAPS